MRALVDPTILREAAERRDLPSGLLSSILVLERNIEIKKDRSARIREQLEHAAEAGSQIEEAPVDETEIEPLRPGPAQPPGPTGSDGG